MLQKYRWGSFVLLAVVGLQLLLSGCFAWKALTRKREKETPPKMLVFPFISNDQEIGNKITQSLIESVDSKVEVLDLQKFKLLLSSTSLSMDIYLPANIPASALTQENFFKEVINKTESRNEFYKDTGIDYVVMGKAKKMTLTELEIGNLETAESAQMQFVEVKNGGILLDEKFKQGLFEVVAPDRIGAAFASKVNKKIKAIRKELKRKLKAERKKS